MPATGLDRHKLVTVFRVEDASGRPAAINYATLGFASGLMALGGMSAAGVTVSEMNLDNSKVLQLVYWPACSCIFSLAVLCLVQVTFNGVPFPLRLRMVLEGAHNLSEAASVWHATNNTNSFNFLIGSAADAAAGTGDGAWALETMRGYTEFYGADSAVEAAATVECSGTQCSSWTNATGHVRIGQPLPHAGAWPGSDRERQRREMKR